MDERERLAWLALAWGAEIGPAAFSRLLAIYGSATAACEASPTELTHGEARLKDSQAQAVPRVRYQFERYGELAARLQARGIRVLLIPDEGYPEALRELSHPPPVVCLRGNLLPADRLAVAIVGTRSPTREGADMAERLARAASADGITVVSGLARGIDTAAHLGALNRSGRTIAIIGSGLANITPIENIPLAERIAERGAVISELPPYAEPTIPNLMARNRLLALFSRGVIVVECRATGGSLATAHAAWQMGRRLYAVQWPEINEWREGCAWLLSQGAEPISEPQQMLEIGLALRAWRPPPKTTGPSSSGKTQLSLF